MAQTGVLSLIPRIALLVVGGLLCFVGVTGAISPEILSGTAELEPSATTGVRVDFGGFHLGLGLFALFCVLAKNWLKPGLTAASITLTLVVVTRLVGLGVDGVTDTQLETLGRESLPFVIAVFGLGMLLRNERASS